MLEKQIFWIKNVLFISDNSAGVLVFIYEYFLLWFFYLSIHLWWLGHLIFNGDTMCSKDSLFRSHSFLSSLGIIKGFWGFRDLKSIFGPVNIWVSYIANHHVSVLCELNTVLGLGDIRHWLTWQASFQLWKFTFDFRNCTFMWFSWRERVHCCMKSLWIYWKEYYMVLCVFVLPSEVIAARQGITDKHEGGWLVFLKFIPRQWVCVFYRQHFVPPHPSRWVMTPVIRQ